MGSKPRLRARLGTVGCYRARHETPRLSPLLSHTAPNRTGAALMPRTQRCARRGCQKTVPRIALRHGDPYCSRPCAEVAYGMITSRDAERSRMMARRGQESGSVLRQRDIRTWERREKARKETIA